MKRVLLAVLLLLAATLLSPICQGQQKLKCEGPYEGKDLTEQDLEIIAGSLKPANRNFCGALLFRANLSRADLREANLTAADLREADLREADLTAADLTAAFLTDANLTDADLREANLRGANLSGAILSGAILSGANLSGAYLSGANLSGANLIDANLSGAELWGANLSGAGLFEANLISAKLSGANLSGADLFGANLSGARLIEANLSGARFEPTDNPETDSIASASNLSQVYFELSPQALVKLRKAFKDSGYREQEREVTYAIKRSEAKNSRTEILKQKKYGKAIEYGFNLLFFDLTSQYGMSPGRSLKILASLIFVFLLPYAIALKRQSGGGIWMLWSKDRVLTSEGTEAPVRITRKGFGLLRTAFYFSLLSAFNIGWREINVGNWLSRLQSHEYTLRATGWVRTVSGIQSLISVYLVALWALSYFGRPFE